MDQIKTCVNKAEKVKNVNRWPYNFDMYDEYLHERTEENALTYAKYLFMRAKRNNAPRKKTVNKRKRVVENNIIDSESDDGVEKLDAATFFEIGISNSSEPSHSDDEYISEEECDDGIEKLDADEFFTNGISDSFAPSKESNKTKCKNVEASRCMMENKNEEENNVENETDDEVEILEAAEYMREGTFVPSTKFDETTMEEEFQIFGGTDAHNAYREKVMDVISKPFDNEEYKLLQETIRSRKYLDYHPDLKRKLKKYRNNKGKRLNMFRGYFFWLQNLMHEGSFKPWNDRDCLAVDPPFL